MRSRPQPQWGATPIERAGWVRDAAAVPMRLFKRRSQETTELPCPRCKTLVPVGDDVCNVCGWDMLDQYKPPPEPVSAPADQDDSTTS
jgi:hypothetical protein